MASCQPRSSSVIAELLGSEGYTDFTHNQVRKYWRNRIQDHRVARTRNIEAAFQETVVPSLSPAQRVILGRYISIIAKANLDTGLRIGLNIDQRERRAEAGA